MRFGKHEPRPLHSPRREGFRPRGERLEVRQLLSIDLANIAASPGPYGVLEAGLNNNSGSGFSVAEVGDVNGDGFDDFVVGAPSIARNGTGVALGNGAGSQVFLVLGSRQVNGPNFDFLNLVAQQRVGDLASLGNGIQNNPINGAPGFSFDGLIFTASQNPNAALGASVTAVGDVNGDGFADFMIGAPGANDSTNTANAAGRAYLIYGGPNLNRTNKMVDLDNPTANSDLNILTFVNNVPNAATGRAVAAAGDILPDGLRDIAIGAPNATINGLPNSGAVYVISGSFLRPARTQTIPLQTVGQGGATNTPGVVFAGATPAQNSGFSLASGGNFAGQTVSGIIQSTLLIGSPQFNVGPGQVSLIYGDPTLINAGETVNGFTSINLNRVGIAGGINGATFVGQNTGDQTGFSVSTAGDFNNDGISDILIGSPGANTAAGQVTMIYGNSGTGALGAITGTINLGSVPNTITTVIFDGAGAGALAGFSLTATGRINNDSLNEILIGSPGFNNAQGIAYLIPGNADLQGTFNLNNTETTPLQGLIIGLSQPVGTPNYFGASVSGLVNTNAAGQTTDADGIGDFLIGAPGFGLNTVAGQRGRRLPARRDLHPVAERGLDGDHLADRGRQAAAAVRDQRDLAGRPPDLHPQRRDEHARVRSVHGPRPHHDHGQRRPPARSHDLDGRGRPRRRRHPRRLIRLQPEVAAQPAERHGDLHRRGPDARRRASSLGSRRYTGTAQVTVTGSPNGGGGGGLPSSRTTPFSNLGGNNTPALPFGERLVPANVTLSKLRYKPLPVAVVHRQYLPTNGFGFRFHNFYHPTKNTFEGSRVAIQRGNNGFGVNALPRKVFTRGRFPNGTFKGRINHHGPTIPPSP